MYLVVIQQNAVFLPVFPLQRTPGRKETILGALIIQNVRMILSAHPEQF